MPKVRENIRLLQASDRYLSRIQNEGQSDSSIYTAKFTLKRLQKAVIPELKANPFIHLITPTIMDDYCYGPNGIRAGIQAVSFNRYRSVLKLFFDYAIAMRWTDVNPMSGVKPARPDAQKPKLMLSATELMSLLDYANNPAERIGLALGMNTGLRGNDIRHLTIFDASLTSGTIQTEIRKVHKMDIKPITSDLHPELVTWLDFYADVMGLDSRADLPNDWLLMPAYHIAAPSAVDRRIKPHPLKIHTRPWRLVQRPLARMGYPTKGEGFHTLRRSSARALFEALRKQGSGTDHALMVVKEYLNHANTAQTEHYLGLNTERTIRDALLKDKPFLSALAAEEQARISGNLEEINGERDSHQLRSVRG